MVTGGGANVHGGGLIYVLHWCTMLKEFYGIFAPL